MCTALAGRAHPTVPRGSAARQLKTAPTDPATGATEGHEQAYRLGDRRVLSALRAPSVSHLRTAPQQYAMRARRARVEAFGRAG